MDIPAYQITVQASNRNLADEVVLTNQHESVKMIA